MRKYISLPVLLVILCLLLGACADRAFGRDETPQNQAASMTGPDKIITRLPNGLLVYIFRDNRFPLACTRLYVRAGSADEKAAQAGISHVLEHMVFKGTDHNARGQIAKKVESLGGYLNAATSFDKTWYITDMPAAHWQTGIDVVRDLAFQASLDPAELEAEKNVVVSELQRGEDSPMRKLFENLQVAALRNTPYGRPIIGYENTIRSITVEDLRAYINEWYQPQNMMLLVGGDIEPQKVLEYAQGVFGKLANHSDLPQRGAINLANAALGSPQLEISHGPWSKVYLGLAMPVPGLRDLRSVDLDVLCYLLGGDGTSTLYQKYKYELQLVDSISVDNMSLARGGMLSITAQLDADKVEEFWNKFTTDMHELSAASFQPEAIARARFNLEDSMDRAGETLNGLVSFRGLVEFELGGQQGEENLRFAQKNVDRPQLQTAIDNWLDTRQARIRVLAPKDARLPDLAAIMNRNWPQASASPVAEKVNSATQIERVDLGDGCGLILIPDKSSPYVSMDLLMSGGNALLAENQQGLANLVAALLTDGAGDYSKPAFERWLAERAASISAHAGLQTFGISLSGPARFNLDYFSMLRDILRRPKFAPDEIKRELDNMRAALVRRNDNPLSFMFAKVNPFLFPDQPYGYDALGTEQTLATFNAMNVRDFWTRQGGMPWTLAIAGDFDREQILAAVKALPAPRMAAENLATPEWGKERELNLRLPDRNQAHLMRIFPTVPPTHADAPALMLLQSILAGQSGLLFTELRDKEGLGYTVTAFNRSMPLAGYMCFYIGTTQDKIEQAREGFSKIIERLKSSELDASLLAAGANSLLGDYVRGQQSLSARAAEAARNAILVYPDNFQKLLIDKAATLTPADLLKVSRKYFVDPYEVSLLP